MTLLAGLHFVRKFFEDKIIVMLIVSKITCKYYVEACELMLRPCFLPSVHSYWHAHSLALTYVHMLYTLARSYTHTRTFIHTHTHPRMLMYIHTRSHAHLHTHTHTRVHTHPHAHSTTRSLPVAPLSLYSYKVTAYRTSWPRRAWTCPCTSPCTLLPSTGCCSAWPTERQRSVGRPLPWVTPPGPRWVTIGQGVCDLFG